METTSSSAPDPSKSSEPEQKKRKIQPYKGVRAHANPIPVSPLHVDWNRLYPAHWNPSPLSSSFSSSSPTSSSFSSSSSSSSSSFALDSTASSQRPSTFLSVSALGKEVRFADVGCGYGGLLVQLGASFPDVLSIGMELRDKVVDYVDDRIQTLRKDHAGQYQNIAVERTNAMKFIVNYFYKGQLEKIFFLFPDPHFKKSNFKRRIISSQLLAEYAYVLREGGLAYTVTDVKDLHDWMVKHFSEHPLFVRVEENELERDPCAKLVLTSSEESRKVDRERGSKYLAVFRRIPDPYSEEKTT